MVMWLYGQESINVSHHPAKFGGHGHSGSRDVFSLSRDLDIMTSPAPALLVSFESNIVDVPTCQISRSWKTGDINPYINSYMDILYKAELTT